MPWVDVSDNDPGRVDQAVRTAIHKCWHALPANSQTMEDLERTMRRLLERALLNFREDSEFFPSSAQEPPEEGDAAEDAEEN